MARYSAPLERLLAVAKSDTGQARRVANFILAWWNADSLGGFDLADIFAVDLSIGADMATIVSWIAEQEGAVYPTEYRADIEAVIQQWRPEVWERSNAPA